jgi:hypothetical protein
MDRKVERAPIPQHYKAIMADHQADYSRHSQPGCYELLCTQNVPWIRTAVQDGYLRVKENVGNQGLQLFVLTPKGKEYCVNQMKKDRTE